MSAQLRIRLPAIRLSVPAVNNKTIEAGRRLDALETLIFSEPDPDVRIAYIHHFNEIWEELTGWSPTS